MPLVGCKNCRKEFYVKPSHQKLGWGKYCSRNCQTQAQFQGKQVECHICSKKIYRSKAKIKHSKSNKFFCTKSCQTIWRNSFYVEEKHPNWTNGNNSYRKRLLRRQENPICTCCSTSDMRILAAHHIDHNRENNTVSNLAWVCFNCHFLIHHYKDFENDFLEKLK